MSGWLVPAPAPRRRGGVPRAAARPRHALTALLIAALVVLAGGAQAAPPADGCGRPDRIGLASRAELTAAGALRLALTVTDAPIDPLTVRPLVFVDGRLRFDAGPLRLPCRVELGWTTPPTGVAHAVHWTLFPWPMVPPTLAALTPDEALLRYAGREPPGLYPWADVELLRPAGAGPAAGTAPVRGRAAPPGALVDDRVEVLAPDGAPLDARLVRAPAGRLLAFRLRFLAGEFGAGSALATCLLDERQLEAFDGRPWRAATVAAGHLLEIDGAVVVPGPGWHRLHCLLLPDAPGERPRTLPRPLLAVYLWGDP